MRRLNRIILINAAGFDYVEFPVGGHTQVIGVNGHGKSTLLRTVLFFYLGTNDKAPYALHETKSDFVSHYLGNPPAYLIYEVSRGLGQPDYHIAVTRPAGRIQFHFIDAPFRKEYYVKDSFVQSMEAVLKNLRDAKCSFETVSSYEEFNHRVYGLVSSPYAVFRPAPRSSGHVGILPRIISGIFTVSQLDADKLKSALTCGVRQDSLSTELDLVLLRNQLENFRRVNHAVKTFLRHEDDASSLLNLAEEFATIKAERQHSIEELVRMAKRLPEEERILNEQQAALAKERAETVERFTSENRGLEEAIQKLGKDIAVFESKIAKGEETDAEYLKRQIGQKIKELERLPALNEKSRFDHEEYRTLTAKYGTEEQRKNQMLVSAQHSLTEISRQIAEKKADCERESHQNINQIDTEKTNTLTALEDEHNQAKIALDPQRKSVQIDRENLNKEFRKLADIKEPTELIQLRKNQSNTKVKQGEEIARQEQLRNQINLAKVTNKHERERIEREAEDERNRLNVNINAFEVDRDRTAAELEKFDSSIARFFQTRAPQSWPQASKTLKREVLFQNAEDLKAKESTNSPESVWGIEFSTDNIPSSMAGYNREDLEFTLKKTKGTLADEHDKLKAARDRYIAISSEHDKRVIEVRDSAESEIQISKDLWSKLQEEVTRLDSRIFTFESQYQKNKQDSRDQLESRAVIVKQAEYRVREDDLALDERYRTRRTKVEDEYKRRRVSLQEAANLRLSGIAEELELARKNHAEESRRIERLFQDTLASQGVNVAVIEAAQERMNKGKTEIERISIYQIEVIEYGQLKREFIDPLPSLKFEKNRLSDSRKSKEIDQKRLVERHEEAMGNLQVRQDKLNNISTGLRNDGEAIRNFKNDLRFVQELGYLHREDLVPAPFYRAKAISELAQAAMNSHERLETIRKNGDRNARTFLNRFDAVTLDRKVLGFSPIHPHFDWFIFVGAELKPFVNGRGIQGMKQIQTQEFAQLIRNICIKNSDFKEGIRQVNQTATSVEKHLKENNFVDVLDSIELKVERVDSNLTRILSQLEEFENVTFSEDRDLFGKGADRSQIDQAIEMFEKLLREIDIGRKQRLQLVDYFDFVIRIHENGHDMGWRKSLDHIGSTGTDYLVKVLIYLSLIEIYRERAIDAKNGSIVHCVLDETGVLAPKYVRSVLEYAQSRGIILITAGHSQQTMGFANWMHVRKCGHRFAAQTVLRKVLKCD